MSKICFVSIELFSCTFKQLGTGYSKTKSKTIQKYDIVKRKKKGSEGYIIIKIDEHLEPACLFKALVELKVYFDLPQDAGSEILYSDEFQKCFDDHIGNIFGEYSFLMSFLTDRAFKSPLILPPFPDSDDDEEKEKKNYSE